MYLLAQDTLNGAEGKITVTRDGRITEICGMKNIKTVAGIQTSDMKTIGTRTVQKKANGVTQTGTGNVYFGSNGSNLFTDMLLQYINTGVNKKPLISPSPTTTPRPAWAIRSWAIMAVC